MARVDADPASPHDALFKETFMQPEHAAGLLRSRMPEAVAARIDWTSLELLPGSFVDDRLSQRHSDLLFSARLTCGSTALLYVLVEHQSEPDPWMALRLHGYVDSIWQRWRKQHPEAPKLPAVLPVVVHHGRRGWAAATSLSQLYDLDEASLRALAPHLPELSFLLDDLARVATEELERRAMTDLGLLVLLCLQRARVSPDIIDDLRRWLWLVRRVLGGPSGRAALAVVLRYLLGVTDVEPDRLAALVAEGLGDEGKEAFMTGAEKLVERARAQALLDAQELIERAKAEALREGRLEGRQEGRLEGRQEGRLEGRQEGRLEGRAELLQRQLRVRFGEVDPAIVRRLADASTEQLDVWAERVLTASTVDEVFA